MCSTFVLYMPEVGRSQPGNFFKLIGQAGQKKAALLRQLLFYRTGWLVPALIIGTSG